MVNRNAPSRTPLRTISLGARIVLVLAAVGVVVTFIGRGGGGHSCPAGVKPAACSYPFGPWHWVEGLVVGGLVGLVIFMAWMAVQRASNR